MGVSKGVGKGVFQSGQVVSHGVGSIGGFAGRRLGLGKKKDQSGNEMLVPVEEVGDGIDSMTAPAGFEVSSIETNATNSNALAGGAAVAGSAIALGTALSSGGGDNDRVVSPGSPGTLPFPPGGTGTLTVTVLGASDIKSSHNGGAKPYVQLKIGSRTYKTEHLKGSDPEW
jgi:hypothetical protein